MNELKNILSGSVPGLRRGGTIIKNNEEGTVVETIEKMSSDVK